jgi:hypothetical protein
MLDPMRDADQSEVGRDVVLFLDLVVFLDQAHHALARLGAGRGAEAASLEKSPASN